MKSDEFKKRFIGFHPLVYRIAYGASGSKSEAEDIAQEVFEKLWRLRDSLSAVENDQAYIVTLSKNLAIDHARKNSRRLSVPLSGDCDLEPSASSEARLEEKETLHTIQRLTALLPATQQEAFRLRHFADFSIPQIAETMGQSETNVRQLLSRGRKTIRKQLERIGISVH